MDRSNVRCLTGKGVLLLFLILVLGGCEAEETMTMDVVPGKRIGEVELGDLRNEIVAVLGNPLQNAPEQVGDSLTRDEWVIGKQLVLAILFSGEEAVQIKLEGPAYLTTEGISGYSSVSALREAYKDMAATVMAHDLENMYLDDVEQGIAFSIRGGKEGELTNEDGDVINVYVHPPGKEVIAVVHHHHSHH